MTNIIAIVFIIAIVGGAIWKMRMNKKNGKSSCGCSCSGCCCGCAIKEDE